MAADIHKFPTPSTAQFIGGLLRCPFCGGPFDWASAARGTKSMEFGLLSCDCSRFPVVDGIPVLKRDDASERAISLIEQGRHEDAVLTMIQPGGTGLSPMWRLASCLPLGHYLQRAAHRQQRQHWRERFAALLRRIEHGDRIPVRTLLDAYYGEKDHHYFALRFGQPRYFVALSLASVLPPPEKPVLDLCCGQGHITRSLAYQAAHQRVIGVDRTFWGLYVAKHSIAPGADYVCCSADHALPFPDKAFSSVFCSDAFHYITNKRSCVRECIRITQDGVIVFTWLHNKRIRLPNDGLPLTPAGYHSLFQDRPHRIVADDDVLDRYFRQQGPDLSTQPQITVLDQKPLLSIVASSQTDVFRAYGPFAEPPHAKGRLGVNPIYKTERAVGNANKKTIRLQRTFPSRFYEEDHSQYKQYMPEQVELDGDILDDLAEGKRTAAVKRLIDRCILLGMSGQDDIHPAVSAAMPMFYAA